MEEETKCKYYEQFVENRNNIVLLYTDNSNYFKIINNGVTEEDHLLFQQINKVPVSIFGLRKVLKREGVSSIYKTLLLLLHELKTEAKENKATSTGVADLWIKLENLYQIRLVIKIKVYHLIDTNKEYDWVVNIKQIRKAEEENDRIMIAKLNHVTKKLTFYDNNNTLVNFVYPKYNDDDIKIIQRSARGDTMSETRLNSNFSYGKVKHRRHKIYKQFDLNDIAEAVAFFSFLGII